MPKEFYTERDIEDIVKRGILSLEVNDNVVLTNMAYEKANALGMQLLRNKPETPPTSPIRPYITQQQSQPAPRAEPKAVQHPVPSLNPSHPQLARDGAQMVTAAQPNGSELRQRIQKAVAARLGDKVDANLLDVIITRVFQDTGIK